MQILQPYLSAAPVANHSLPGSTVQQRTQPMWPEITLNSFQGACQAGFGMEGAFLMANTIVFGGKYNC